MERRSALMPPHSHSHSHAPMCVLPCLERSQGFSAHTCLQGASATVMHRPKVVVFDLDACLWYPEMDMLTSPFRLDGRSGRLFDRHTTELTLYEVPSVDGARPHTSVLETRSLLCAAWCRALLIFFTSCIHTRTGQTHWWRTCWSGPAPAAVAVLVSSLMTRCVASRWNVQLCVAHRRA